jgi:hypothetical protein
MYCALMLRDRAPEPRCLSTVSWLLYSLCYCSLFSWSWIRVLEFCTLQKLVTSDCRSQFCYMIRWNLYLVTCVRSSYVAFFYLALVYCVIFFQLVLCWDPTRFSPIAQRPLVAQALLTITLRHTTLGRSPLDEWSARRRHLYLTTGNIH